MYIFFNFWLWLKNFWPSAIKNGGVVTAKIYVFMGQFQEIRIFRGLFITLGFWANFFSLLSTNVRRGFQNCILRVRRNKLKKKLTFLKKSTSYKKFVGAVKIGFYCPKKQLQAKKNSLKNFQFSKHVRKLNKKISFSIEKILAELSEFHPLFLLDHVEGKYFFWKRL